jgi:hypothetical protein
MTRSLLPVLGLIVLVGAFWQSRIVGPGLTYGLASSDLFLYAYPTYQEMYARLAVGVVPRWNPYQLCGTPWIATLQGGFFYPPHLLYLLLPTYTALAASALLHLVLVALTTAAFARRAGLAWCGALLAAVLFALRGTLPFALIQPCMLEAAAWLPLGALATLRLVDGDRRRGVALLALATGASFLAGYPQHTIYLLYGWATLLPALLLGARLPARQWPVAGAAFAAAVLLGVLLASVQLFPAAELARLGTRTMRALTPTQMLSLGAAGMANFGAGFMSGEAIAGSHLSFGVVGLSVLSTAFLRPGPSVLAVWALLLGALTAVLATGPLTRLFSLYTALPLLGPFRGPFRVLLLTDFCFAVLAGSALDVMWRRGALEPRATPANAFWVVMRGAVIVGIGAVILWAVRLGMPAAPSLTLATVGVWAVVTFPGLRSLGRPLALVLLTVAAAELFRATPIGAKLPYSARSVAVYRTHEAVYADLAARTGHDRIWVLGGGMPQLAPKLATVHRTRAVDDYEPVSLGRQSDYFMYFMQGATTEPWIFDGGAASLGARPGVAPPANRRRLLDLAAVRFVLVSSFVLRRPEVAAFVGEAGLVRRTLPRQDVVLFENPHALPRAFTVYHVRSAPPAEEVLRLLSQPAFDPLAESYVEGAAHVDGTADASLRGEPAVITRDEEQLVEVEGTLAAPGLLVLADSFFPGWHATVDGVAAPILPTNHLFRGVPVPAGRHRVRFEYRPWTLLAGGGASGVGLLVVAGLCLSGRPPR